jgi:hypothetical protein
MGQLQGKKNIGLVRQPQLINMKQNNKEYPQFIIGIFSLEQKGKQILNIALKILLSQLRDSIGTQEV